MVIQTKYMHTNLIAKDWWALSSFYQQVFGSVPCPPERDYQGEKIETGSGIPGGRTESYVRIERLPHDRG